MAKLLATDLHPYVAPMAAEPANSAIEDGESSELEKYITLCAECESIAVQIHPSYEKQYVNVAAMMSMPRHCHPPLLIPRSQPNVSSWERKRRFSKTCKQDSKANPRKTRARQQANHLVRTLLSKHRKRSKGRRKLHQVKLRRDLERERKKELQGTPGQKTTNGSWQQR